MNCCTYCMCFIPVGPLPRGGRSLCRADGIILLLLKWSWCLGRGLGLLCVACPFFTTDSHGGLYTSF